MSIARWQSCQELILVVHFNEPFLHANVNSILAVVVSNSVAMATAANQFAATGWHTNLNVNALRTTAVDVMPGGTGILDRNDL